MKIPATAREQLLLARQMGHELSVETRSNPEYPDAPSKTWVSCSCGYRSTARRSKAAVNSTLAWHLGKAIAEGLDQVNGAAG